MFIRNVISILQRVEKNVFQIKKKKADHYHESL